MLQKQLTVKTRNKSHKYCFQFFRLLVAPSLKTPFPYGINTQLFKNNLTQNHKAANADNNVLT